MFNLSFPHSQNHAVLMTNHVSKKEKKRGVKGVILLIAEPSSYILT